VLFSILLYIINMIGNIRRIIVVKIVILF